MFSSGKQTCLVVESRHVQWSRAHIFSGGKQTCSVVESTHI